jgi:hypothetical protein
MSLSYFPTIEFQGRGLLHLHTIMFYPREEYNPRADMRIHYDPRPSYLNFLRRRQGLLRGAIYRSAQESVYLVMYILACIIDKDVSVS